MATSDNILKYTIANKLTEEKVLMSSICGLDDVKYKIDMQVISYIENPEFNNYLEKGVVKPMPRILLSGPPGCGKTQIAKAIAYKLHYRL